MTSVTCNLMHMQLFLAFIVFDVIVNVCSARGGSSSHGTSSGDGGSSGGGSSSTPLIIAIVVPIGITVFIVVIVVLIVCWKAKYSRARRMAIMPSTAPYAVVQQQQQKQYAPPLYEWTSATYFETNKSSHMLV
jgi:preprotein translocase subunit SecG